MKKLLVTLMALMMTLTLSVSLAEETADPAWYELSAENKVLTLRLPGNVKSGMTWDFEISNEDALEMLTMETIEGPSEGMAGTPFTTVISFRALEKPESSVMLILDYHFPEEELGAKTWTLEVEIGDDLSILPVAAQQITRNLTDWAEIDATGATFTVRLPGSWDFSITDPQLVDSLAAEYDEELQLTCISFMALENAQGIAEIIFTQENLSYSVLLDVAADGTLDYKYFAEYEILQ